MIYIHNSLREYVKIVGLQGYEFCLSVFLDVHVGDNTCDMADVIPAEHNHLLQVFHLSVSVHLHTVCSVS